MNTAGLFPILDVLDRLATLITADRDLTARALGLLLLSKRFDKNEDIFQDPTDIILNQGLKEPKI